MDRAAGGEADPEHGGEVERTDEVVQRVHVQSHDGALTHIDDLHTCHDLLVEVLDRRRLNRATLARQMLLDRVATEPRDVVGRLVGLQAQDPDLPTSGCGAGSPASRTTTSPPH